MAYKQFLIVGLATCLLSCGGGDVCLYTDTCSAEATTVQEGVVEDGVDEEVDEEVEEGGFLGSSYLDCSNLDPDKVYLHGTLSEGAAYLDALTDPENPTLFCVGFPTSTIDGVITEQGNYIYSHDDTFYTMNQDAMNQDAGDSITDQYPENEVDNDTMLFTAKPNSCGVGIIKINPSNNDIYYECPCRNLRWLHVDTQPFKIG